MVAAFCVSGYSSTYTRAGQKPFNPVLGETYECIREDKGWKFIAEQVTRTQFLASTASSHFTCSRIWYLMIMSSKILLLSVSFVVYYINHSVSFVVYYMNHNVTPASSLCNVSYAI